MKAEGPNLKCTYCPHALSVEVGYQLLSMQGRSVGTIQDKLVVSSISQEKVAVHLCSLYSGLDLQQRSQFLFQLADNYELDQDNIKKEKDKILPTEIRVDQPSICTKVNVMEAIEASSQ